MANGKPGRPKTAPTQQEILNRTDIIDDLKLFSLPELQAILGCSYRSLQRYVQSGKLKGTKCCGKWRVSKAELERFIKAGEKPDNK